jgi:hypothetical protein
MPADDTPRQKKQASAPEYRDDLRHFRIEQALPQDPLPDHPARAEQDHLHGRLQARNLSTGV